MCFIDRGVHTEEDAAADNFDNRRRDLLVLRERSSCATTILTEFLRRALRQQKSCEGSTPMRRAIAETFAPDIKTSATACTLNASDHRRRGCKSPPSSRSMTASIIWKLLSPDVGADIVNTRAYDSCVNIRSSNDPPRQGGIFG